MTRLLAATAAALLASTAAYAADPVGADSFNLETSFDLSALTADNFMEVIEPAAKAEGEFTFFDFTNSFGPLFTNHLLPAFEEAYGIKVDYVRGKGSTAVQQLVAAINAGSEAPADIYFIGSGGTLTTLLQEEMIANIPLNTLLPNAAGFDAEQFLKAAGKEHGGIYMPFHRNQTSMVYNTAMIDAGEMPTNLVDLKAWAEANPGKLAVTNPTRGGSGDGFLQSVANGFVEGEECRAPITNYAVTEEEATAWAESDCLTATWEFYSSLLESVELTNGNSDTLTLVANGAVVMGTAWEDMAFDFMGRGLLPPTTRQTILESGQVGGGDGMFVPVKSEKPASALLFLNFMASQDMQLLKLSVNGSRSARTDIDPTASFSEEEANKLVPTAEFAERARPQMPQPIKNALKAYFTANILSQ